MPTTPRTGQTTKQAPGPAGRRTHQRTDCELLVDFSIPTTGQTGTARCVNIGLGGICVEFPVEMVIPAEVALQIHVPGQAPLVANGRVVWAVTDRLDAPFPAGIQFQKLPDAQRRHLYDLVDHLTD
ncbi:MAG: PilZ domain-containing protein [Planctomycetota bacterium]|nr:PilZ domain-containing protein [Planctomycetota bacterium]